MQKEERKTEEEKETLYAVEIEGLMPVKLLTANEQYSLLFAFSILICLNQVQLLYIHGREVIGAELGLVSVLPY